jgi:polyisoprenoid-binding protein YceI
MFHILFACLFFVLQGHSQIKEGVAQITFEFPSKRVSGSIGDLRSQSTIDRDSFPNSVLSGSVSLESLKTGNFLRDWHLMAEKYFHRKEQDRLYFNSTRIESTSEGYRITGELKIRGNKREVIFYGNLEAGELRMDGTINVADWGMPIVREYENNKVMIKLALPLKD